MIARPRVCRHFFVAGADQLHHVSVTEELSASVPGLPSLTIG